MSSGIGWDWLAALCAEQNIPFVLGYALYMKAIDGGQVRGQVTVTLSLRPLDSGGLIRCSVRSCDPHALASVIDRSYFSGPLGMDHSPVPRLTLWQ